MAARARPSCRRSGRPRGAGATEAQLGARPPAISASGAMEVLPDVGGERLEGRDVERPRSRRERAAGPRPRNSRSMPTRKAARVLPEPVGAAISVSAPLRIAGQPAPGARSALGEPTGEPGADGRVEARERVHRGRVYPRARNGPGAGGDRPRGAREGAAANAPRHLRERAAPGRGRSRPPLRRDGGAGAPHPRARVRLDLGRRAPRHARLPLLPSPAVPPAPRRRGRGDGDGDQPDPAAAPQPGRGGRDRRLPGRDHRRAVPAGRRARLSPRGVRRLRRADGRAREPARRGDRDHPPAVDRGRR